MAARFEIKVNGERVCISGLEDDGVLTAIVNFVKRADEEGQYGLSASALGRFLPSHDRPQHANWSMPEVTIDDQITICILPDGEFAPPQDMFEHPRASIDDEQFGKLDYNINAWDGNFEIPCPPFTRCRVHLWGDTDGPTDSQRQRFNDFVQRHDSLWPSIASALVNCHSEIDNIKELNAKLRPLICIDMQPDGTELELTYSVQGEPEFRAYFVTLRDWKVAEVCKVE